MGAALSVVIAVGIPLGVGMAVGITVPHDIKGWYKRLKKPSWTPPPQAYGPIWTILYASMGAASWLVWKSGATGLPLTLYGIQLVLNWAYTPLFFKSHQIGYAMLDSFALVGAVAVTAYEFQKHDLNASYLMLPYLAWTTYAAALTYDIWKKNPKHRGDGTNIGDVAKDAAQTVAQSVQDAAQQAAGKADEVLQNLRGEAAEAKGEAEQKAGELKHETEKKAGEAKRETEKKADAAKRA